MWMPLPGSLCCRQDFAPIMIEQKKVIDDYVFDRNHHTMPLMDPYQFRMKLINLSSENGIDSFVRLTNHRYGTSYFGDKCIMFVCQCSTTKRDGEYSRD